MVVMKSPIRRRSLVEVHRMDWKTTPGSGHHQDEHDDPSRKMTDIPTCHGTLAWWKPITLYVITSVQAMPEARARGRLR